VQAGKPHQVAIDIPKVVFQKFRNEVCAAADERWKVTLIAESELMIQPMGRPLPPKPTANPKFVGVKDDFSQN
jgi:hypothetical protein